MATLYKPGQTVPVSGQYERVDRFNQRMGLEVTCVRGEPFPAGLHHGQTYILVDPTKHRR